MTNHKIKNPNELIGKTVTWYAKSDKKKIKCKVIIYGKIQESHDWSYLGKIIDSETVKLRKFEEISNNATIKNK